jgi:hypothetical protein
MARQYSLNEKYQAAAAMVASGSSVAAGEQLGIPPTTIRTWMKTDEFSRMVQEVRAEYGEKIRANLARVIKEGTDQILDRIKNGDHVLGKDGELIRKPMSGRDLTIAAGTAFDKLRIVENQPTSISARQEVYNGTETVLERLKRQIRESLDERDAENRRAELGERDSGPESTSA